MTELVLKECPKAYIRETHRSKSPEETHTFVEGMKEVLGMKEFREATDLDRIGIPVFTCHRIRPDNSITDHTGKGLSRTQAQVSLTMESAERYSSEFRNEYMNELVKGSYDTLKKKHAVINPEDLILPQFCRYNHDRDIHWTWGYDLVTNAPILIPACSVYHPFHLDNPPLLNTHTNGIAAGNTMEEAVSHALAEVIERDAWSINQFTGEAYDALFIEDSLENEFIIDIVEQFVNADIEIVAKDITSDIGVPVIAAFSNDLVYKKMIPIEGFGAHLDPKAAMARALLEIATTRCLFIQKHGIEPFRPNYVDGAVVENHENDYRFCAFHQKGLAELTSEYSDDILQDIYIMMNKLVDRGFDKIIAVNLTRQDIGIPTARMIVPGMEVYCFDKMRIGRRLFDALSKEG
jgi:putative methanogenesis marker protein 1